MQITIGNLFELEVTSHPSIFLRLPFIGQGLLAPGTGLSCGDSWRTLKEAGQV